MTSNRFVDNMVKIHHHWLQFHPLFKIEASEAHHPVTEKDISELFAKGAIELCTGGA